MANMQLFPDAQNLMITGGMFNQNHHYHVGGIDVGLHILKQHIAADAIYDSAERFPPPQCHPGTREKIIKTIMDWVNDPEAKEQAMWLYGPAGAGKSAIAHTIAMLLQEFSDSQYSKYAASFFFARGAPGRGDGNKLFSTIAYQLAIISPSFRSQLDTAMLKNPTLPTKSIDVQLRNLIIEPLKRVQDWPSHFPTVIIDGLDECLGSKRTQSALLLHIYNAVHEHKIPLRFLIVSRPEYWIADCFEVGCFSGTTRLLSLRDDTEADADIEKYLREEFDRIYEENLALMTSVSRPWPPDYIVKRFVCNASGQFVYASTVLNFVGNSSDFCDPRVQLHLLETSQPHRASAFSNLDALYANILSVYPRLESLKRVLGGIMLEFDEVIVQEFLGVESGEIRLILRAINSLIRRDKQEYPDIYCVLERTYGPPVFENQTISFCHVSFEEFLRNRPRSGPYAVDNLWEIKTDALCAIIQHGCKMLQGGRDAEQTISRIGLSKYRHLLDDQQFKHTYDLDPVITAVMRLRDILQTLLDYHPVHIPHAAHIVWFTNKMIEWLPNIFANLRRHGRKRFNQYQEHFKSLINALNVARTISARQVLEAIPKALPVFEYLVSDAGIFNEKYLCNTIKVAMDITDDAIISELQHLQNIVYVSFNRDGSARIHGMWRVFAEELFKATGDRLDIGQHIVALDKLVWNRIAKHAIEIIRGAADLSDYSYVRNFLEYRRLSDIHSEDYFQDANNMAILNLIVCQDFLGTEVYEWSIDLAISMLSWLKRQITGPSKAVIAKHDTTLLRKMKISANRIFQNEFLEHFICDDSSTLRVESNDGSSCIYFRISPQLNGGTCSITEHLVTRSLWYYSNGVNEVYEDNLYRWVHEFNNVMMTSDASGIICPSDWYPHLAQFLLIRLVKTQYGMLHKDYANYWTHFTQKVFVPLTQCIPYAIPTKTNLNAIRALHYLCPKIEPIRQWRPPFGFCSLVIDFLKKFDRSSLPSLEFAQLQTWLLELKTHESKRITQEEELLWYATEDDYTSDEDSSDEDVSGSDDWTTDEDD